MRRSIGSSPCRATALPRAKPPKSEQAYARAARASSSVPNACSRTRNTQCRCSAPPAITPATAACVAAAARKPTRAHAPEALSVEEKKANDDAAAAAAGVALAATRPPSSSQAGGGSDSMRRTSATSSFAPRATSALSGGRCSKKRMMSSSAAKSSAQGLQPASDDSKSSCRAAPTHSSASVKAGRRRRSAHGTSARGKLSRRRSRRRRHARRLQTKTGSAQRPTSRCATRPQRLPTRLRRSARAATPDVPKDAAMRATLQRPPPRCMQRSSPLATRLRPDGAQGPTQHQLRRVQGRSAPARHGCPARPAGAAVRPCARTRRAARAPGGEEAR